MLNSLKIMKSPTWRTVSIEIQCTKCNLVSLWMFETVYVFYFWNPELHIQYSKRVCFLIGVVTAYETNLGKGMGPKWWAVTVTEICLLVYRKLRLNTRKSVFCWILFPFISRHPFPSVQLLRKTQFLRVNDVTSTQASISILMCRFLWFKIQKMAC